MAQREQDLAARIAADFGEDRVSTAGLADLGFGALAPRAVLYPTSAREAAAMLAFAAAEKLRVAPVGGGTRRALGNDPRGLDLVLSTSRLDAILEHAPQDFVVTAQAGVPIERLQAALAPHGQWLPLDPPASPPSTLGGILSTDASGPHRFLHGAGRDLLIGLEAALPDGTVVRSGGRVVKNVAGYDLKKLFVGAIGTLGVITAVSLKLQAIPEHETLIAAGFPDYGSAGATAGRILRAGYELAALDLLNRSAFLAAGLAGFLEDAGCALLAGLVGTREANEAQASEVAVLCARGGGLGTRALSGEDCAATWRRIRDVQAPASPDTGGAAFRIAVPLGDTAAVAARSEALLPPEAAPRIVSRAGNGVLHVQTDPADREAMLAALRDLRGEATRRGGALVIERAPVAIRSTLDAWGAPPAGIPLQAEIKRAFDPAGTLVPGRFLGGL